MVQNLIFISLVALARCNAACATGKSEPNPRNQFFDIDLLKHVAEEKSGNVALSPTSLKSTLFMLMEGTEGDTRNELRRALRLSPDAVEMADQLATYMTALRSNSSGSVLEVANGVFFSDKLRPKKAFENVIRQVYRSELKAVNFSDPFIAAESVNMWVRNKTRQLIPELLEPLSLSPTSSVLVLNALYFKATWKTAFDPQLTRPKCFYRGDQCVLAKTMQLHSELKYAYIEELRAHAVELPYESEAHSAVLLVPRDRDGCGTITQDLPHVSLSRVLSLLEPTDVQLFVPRFSIDFTHDFCASLREIKIQKLFTSSAEMAAMLDGDSRGVRVDSVVQRVALQVSELGTVGAAATGALVVPLIGSNTVRLNIDRPFLFFIRDNESGALLFEGKLEEPELA